jgi:DNA-binding transcriptional ArsR family regulator
MDSSTTATMENSSSADHEEINIVDISELAELLDGHPLRETADHLGDYLGVGVDAISLMMFVSRAAGRLGIPINLAIYSDDPGAEHLIADRIINIVPETVKRAETIKRFRDLVEQAFEDTELVLVRSLHNDLFRFATEAACRDTAKACPPSVWLISDDQSAVPRLGPTLALMARQTDRSLTGFGHHFSRTPESEERPSLKKLRQVMLQLGHRRRYECPFQDRLRAALKPSLTIVFSRTLATIAALRIEMANIKGEYQPKSESVISIDDYRVTRSLLIALPTPRELSHLSPYAAETGAELYEAFVENSNHQLTIPDNSAFGNKAFTRQQAVETSGQSYNTVKDHLKRLEDEGIVESLLVNELRKNARVRRQGVQIYYRFSPTKSPPFGTSSPFASLPTVEQIAGERKASLQSQQERGQ